MALSQEQKDKMAAGRKAAAEKKKLEPKEATPKKVASVGLVSMETVEKLLEKQKAEFKSELEKVKAESHNNNIDGRKYQPIDKTEIPDSDLLDKPVFYYAWGRSLTLSGYVMRGRAVNPPYARPIKLKSLPPDIAFDQAGNRVELPKCGTIDGIWSKREIEFIENSLQFKGGVIMKDLAKLNPEHAASQNMRMQAMTEVSRMTQAELITNCRNRHITGLDNNFSAMQTALIDSFYKEFSGKTGSVNEEIASRSAKEYEKATAV